MINEQHFTCRICKNALHNKPFIARELMLNTRHSFVYFECADCGCVQIADIPQNISEYYPNNYYSQQKPQEIKSSLRLFLLRQLMKYRLGKFNPLGALLSHIKEDGISPYRWIKGGYLDFSSHILDVGCGSGERILKMKQAGFSNVQGIDPFIENDLHYDSGVSVYKKSLEETEGTFDFIMLHHSLEHMPDQFKAMREVYRLLKNNSYAMIAIPVSSGFLLRKYKSKAFHLDAPRHFYLHTVSSLDLLARDCGLEVKDYFYDNNFTFVLESEKYIRNLSGTDTLNFGKKQKREIIKELNKLNKLNDGDAICFYLYKS